jgi:hypothetical protein
MTDGPENLMLTFLRRIDTRIGVIETVMREHTTRLAHIDEVLGQVRRRQVLDAERLAMEGVRLDRHATDIERLKRRADLLD